MGTHATNSKLSVEISRALVLNTGGTIGMALNPEHPEHGLAPVKNRFVKVCQSHPSLNDENFRKRLLKAGKLQDKFLILPERLDGGKRRVAYHIEEYSELIDSSNFTVKNWQKLCRDIRDNYESYNGFVILHGTDTMVYTASALSFMLVNLNKTVILTGSQKPIFENRTDGLSNLVSSLLIAGLKVVPEVSILTFNRLLRGNRCIKRSTEEFFCFDTCNLLPLMTLGVKTHVNDCLIMPQAKKKFYAHIAMNENVSLLRIFPGISSRAINAALGEPYQGIVLHTYGAGKRPH
uniref:asparaginase n=1 Tax=Lygus hesperus TaxID=30085 RepID=A0A0A9X3J5_LYGHE